MTEVYKFRLPDGQEHAFHGSASDLKKHHPDAELMGRLVVDNLGQGTWEPYSLQRAKAAERSAANGEQEAKPTTTTTAAPAAEPVAVVIEAAPAKKAKDA